MVHKVADADDFKAGPTCSSSTDIHYRIDGLIAQRNVSTKKNQTFIRINKREIHVSKILHIFGSLTDGYTTGKISMKFKIIDHMNFHYKESDILLLNNEKSQKIV